jgi:hypothetical protein
VAASVDGAIGAGFGPAPAAISAWISSSGRRNRPSNAAHSKMVFWGFFGAAAGAFGSFGASGGFCALGAFGLFGLIGGFGRFGSSVASGWFGAFRAFGAPGERGSVRVLGCVVTAASAAIC